MITHYGLQIESPFDLKNTAAVSISVKKGEIKNIDRAGASGVLAIIVEDKGVLNYTENILKNGLYHTYIYLEGKHSTVNINSRINLVEDISDIAHQVFHDKGNTISNIVTRGVVNGSATVIYTSNISVSHKVISIQGKQDAQFMLLENTAKVKTIPGLSVYSDDVSCSHKVSVTPVDKKKIEFLAMRGYKEDEAKETLIKAFLK